MQEALRSLWNILRDQGTLNTLTAMTLITTAIRSTIKAATSRRQRRMHTPRHFKKNLLLVAPQKNLFYRRLLIQGSKLPQQPWPGFGRVPYAHLKNSCYLINVL